MTLRFRHLLIAFFALLCCCNAAAQTKLFVVNGQTISLERAENSVGVFLRAFRPNLATSRWDVDVTVTNGSTRTLKTPLILRFDTAVQISPGVVGASLDADGLPYLDISGLATAGDFLPGQALRTFTMSFGDGRTKPTIAIGIYSQPQTPLVNLAALQVLTADGAPLEGVTAEEIGPAQPRSFSGGRGGWFSLEVSPGVRGWRFSASGRAPVVRLAPSGADRVTELSSPRLAKLSSDGPTAFSAATIPAPIPAGWSPLAAAFLQTGTSILDLNETLENGAVAVLARWDDAAVSWRTVQIVNGTGSKNVSVDVSDAGVFAVLRADQAPVTPSSPIVGGIVRGISVSTPATLTATGFANPASRTASSDPALVQTEAVVELASSAGALSSGLSIPCEITEEYQLRDGTRRILPSYRMIVVGYQRPRGTNAGSLVGRFPLRPFQLLTGEKLAEAIVRVQVIRPGGFVGEVFENNGGSLTHGSVRVAATSGDFARPEAVILQEISLPPTNGIAPAELEVARAFELSVSSTENGRKLGLTFGPQAPNKTYVLARAVFDEGRHGFQPVQRFVTGADGILHSTEPATDGLVGMDGGGQFVLFQTTGPEAVVSGVARDSNGQAKRGLTVRRGPWTAFSDGTGAFRLLAPSGASEVTAVDPTTGDTGSNSIQIAADLAPAQTTVDSAARGPRIISISPSNNATNVPRVVAVVINFNKPVNPTTIVGGGVQLLNSTNGVVTAPLTLNLAGDTVTVLPVSPLASGEIYRVRVADTVTDLFSRPVEGDREFTFTTAVDTFVRGAAAEVIIFEPGATNLTAEILQKIPAYDPARDRDGVVIQGSQGTAEPRAKVILLNESTDETATTLADADGSFVSTVHGSVQDFISAIVVNANGTQNRIPATRQKFDDGSVGLFGAGGTITSSGPGAPVDLIVDPGSVHGRTVFKIDTITTDSFQQLMNGKLPAGARAPLGAFQLTESADPLGAPAHISMPVKLADLGLPAGSNPTNFAFVVTRAVIFDGKPVHQIVDMATYEPTGPEGGRVRTQSPPFVGMLARRLADLAKMAGLSPANSVVTASSSGNPHQGTTAAYGILPVDQATAGLRVGGFVRAVTKHDDGSETVAPLGGAIVRVFHPEDEDDPGDPNVVYEGDLVSISDERGEFGFFFKPVVADMSRQMVATHARFPFQKPRSGPFSADRAGANVVRTELRFTELPQVVVASDGVQKPVVTVGHDPALPPAGTGPNDGATVFVTAVDDKVVSVPILNVTEVQDLQGDPLPFGTVTVSAVPPTEDKPGRKVREFHVTMKQPGRAMFEASASDGMTGTIFTQHAISFGAGRVLPPPDPNDSVPMRVIFAWPPPGGTNVPNLMPITLRFNKPVRSGLLAQAQPDWITFTSGHFVRRVTPTPDRREITVFYDGPSTGPVQMVVGPGLMGDTGGPFDQNTLEAGTQSFEVQFTQTAGVSQELDGDAGAGVVMLGRFSYVLERKFVGSQPVGTLRVLDFEDPGEPEETQSVRIRYPTAMSLIANYAMRNANGDCETNNMLALFSGTANEPKFLQLAKLAGGEVTLGPKLVLSGGGTDGEGHRSVAINSTIAESQSQIVRSRWDPPYLAYFELGADVTSVKLINLASFQQVALKDGILDSFPVGQGNDGTDVNGDGDFCDNDDGDVPPKPDGDPLIPPGLAFSVTPKNARERIIDFDFNAGLGVIFSISSFIAEESRPRFSTLLSAGEASLLDTAFVEFASGDSPRRMLFLPAVTLQTPTNRIVRDIAVVSLGQASGDGALAVIDVSTPSTPTLLNRFTLPLGEGTPASIQKRDDGLLAVTTTHSTLLVDPTKLTASNQSATHPSIVGRIDASGTGVRDFVADPTGINITYGGESRRYLETAPKFSFVRFDTNKVINPNRIADLSSPEIAEFLKIAAPVDAAEVTPAPNGSAPGLDPSRHYYVLADIPGGAADSSGKLALVLSAVDSSGMPQVELGGTVVPAVVGDEQLDSALLSRRVIDVLFVLTKVKKAGQGVLQAATIAQKIRAGLGSLKTIKRAIQKLGALGRMLKLMPDKFEARRLSNNPDDPLYNKFLAGPFIVLGGVPTLDDMKALKAQADSLQVDRAYLRPSPRLWVGLPSQRVPTLFSLQPVNPFGPPESKLKPFVSELRLNPNAAIAGISIPHSREIIEQIATLNGLPTSPTSSLDFIQQITLVVSMLNNLPFFGAVVSGDWKPMLVPGAHGMLRVNFNERPVIFVPGFAGSQLEIHNQNRWLGLPNALVDRERAFLRVNPDGTPVEPTFATDAVRFALETSVINLQSIYGDWLEHLSDELGLVEYDYRKAGGSFQLSGEQIQRMLGFGPEANFSQTPIPSLYVFPYDWRLDNDIAARKLKDYVRLALEMHPDADGIDLVAHSNGGLVSRAY
ncbi:MAG TPA: Ig-like domain-containing protein, partial [Verrucomicrobiae bacterium]